MGLLERARRRVKEQTDERLFKDLDKAVFAAQCLAEGMTVRDASSTVEVDASTITRWKRKKEFKRMVEYFEQATAALNGTSWDTAASQAAIRLTTGIGDYLDSNGNLREDLPLALGVLVDGIKWNKDGKPELKLVSWRDAVAVLQTHHNVIREEGKQAQELQAQLSGIEQLEHVNNVLSEKGLTLGDVINQIEHFKVTDDNL